MLKTIILVTGTCQQQWPLASLLREHNPDLSFCSALTAQDLAAINPNILREARLISFANDVAIPPGFLAQLGYGAYTFHAAPIQYPGLPPADNACDDPRTFSVIAQSLTIWPDVSDVIGLETFTIAGDAGMADTTQSVFARLARLFWRMSSAIASEFVDLPDVLSGHHCPESRLIH